MERSRRLADLLAIPTGELFPDRFDHLPLPRDHLQRPGHILAQLAQPRSAAALAPRRLGNHHALARQVVGEGVSFGALARGARHIRGLRHGDFRGEFILAGAGCEFLELQRQLIDQPLRSLGARAVELTLEPGELDLDAEEIVTAAVEIFEESGLDAVSMRSVSARLGVSPVPLYSRVGNKEALLDAIAERRLADRAPPANGGEPWDEYAARWARELRDRSRRVRDSRLLLWPGRDAYVEANEPPDPAKDKRLNGSFYGVSPAPDGSIWGTVQGMPGGLGRLSPGPNPPATSLTEYFEVPFNNPKAAGSGLSPRGLASLHRQIARREVHRQYLALVRGELRPAEGIIDAPIGRDPADRKRMMSHGIGARPARTRYRTLERYPAFSLIEATLETGRTHQIRVHLAWLKNPVVGDEVYGGGRDKTIADLAVRRLVSKLNRQFLHAAELGFRQPTNHKSLKFTAALPDDLQALLNLIKGSGADVS